MATTLFRINANVPVMCNDGRNPSMFWGDEAQYHAIRDTAEAACRRLQAGGAYGIGQLPEYGVVEVTRSDFAVDWLGFDEWSKACHQAGVDPETAGLKLQDCPRR
jgi:hypothetical protein